MRARKKATDLQQGVIANEEERHIDYNEAEVRVATVHTRQDIVLLVSYLETACGELSNIRIILWLIFLLLAVTQTRGILW
jgi:hypothetical protein